jgi:hypothetical protein
MWAGLLEECIEIWDATTVKNDYGEAKETRALSYSTRAKVGHVGGNRTVINSEIQIPYQKNFVVRAYVPIKDTSWIKYNDKYYRVLSIELDRQLKQKIIITEIVNE